MLKAALIYGAIRSTLAHPRNLIGGRLRHSYLPNWNISAWIVRVTKAIC
jgi:hypothetical protein